MKHGDGNVGLAYFKERGFLTHTIEKFQLGYAPDAPDVLTKAALKAGYQLDVMKKAGLTSPKENSTYDFFRNRVMFPIHNMTGKVVGFGGRIMVKDEKAPKYVNTPESEVYQKSKILYGAYFAKNAIRKKDECLMVEGYTDVISLHQAGIENAVASSGTALTPDQIRLIKRITPNITMLYDGDAAGIKAALRGTDLILEEGMNVRVVILPNPEDPDSYVRKVGEEAFNQYIKDNRKDLILFKTSLLAEEVKNDPARKSELIRDIINSIAKIPDAIQRMVYIKECSQLFEMNEQILITEVNKLKRKRASEDSKKQPDETESVIANEDKLPQSIHQEQFNQATSHTHIVELDIARILMEFGAWKTEVEDDSPTVTQYVLEEIEGLDLETPKYKKILDLVKREFADGRVHDEKFFVNNDDETITAIAIETLAQPYSLSDNWWTKYKIVIPEKKNMFLKDIQSTVIRFKQFRNMAELQKLQRLMQETTNEAELTKLMKLHKLLMEQKKGVCQNSGQCYLPPGDLGLWSEAILKNTNNH